MYCIPMRTKFVDLNLSWHVWWETTGVRRKPGLCTQTCMRSSLSLVWHHLILTQAEKRYWISAQPVSFSVTLSVPRLAKMGLLTLNKAFNCSVWLMWRWFNWLTIDFGYSEATSAMYQIRPRSCCISPLSQGNVRGHHVSAARCISISKRPLGFDEFM